MKPRACTCGDCRALDAEFPTEGQQLALPTHRGRGGVVTRRRASDPQPHSRRKPVTKATKMTAAPAPEPTIHDLMPSTPEMVPLIRLRRAPENVRATDPGADVEGLAEDIAAHGLLQSLIGYHGDAKLVGGPFDGERAIMIIGGGRRLKALMRLLDDGTIAADWPVPVLVRDRAEAIELSLAENLARRDMNPADEYAAFAALLAPGTMSPADLAKRFGFTERHVKQRLKLAACAPEIIEALREGSMTVAAAQAYARAADIDAQRKVFAAQAKKPFDKHDPFKVKNDLARESRTTDWSLYRFIGDKAYERAGGGYEDSGLFEDDSANARRLTSAAIVERVAREHIDFQMLRLSREFAERLDLDPAQVQGHVVWPGLTWDRGSMLYHHSIEKRAPDGFAWVGWDYDHRRVEAARRTIANNHIACQLLVAIDDEGELIPVPKGFFVEKHQVAAIVPPPGAVAPTPPGKSEEEWQAERRAIAIRREAAKVAVGPFAGTPLEGRAFWPSDGYGLQPFSPIERADIGKGTMVAVQIFVSDDAIEAHLKEGEQRLDQRIAAEAAEREERERLKAEKAERDQAKWDELVALDPPPEVLLTDDGNLWTKTEQGWTVEGEEDELGYAETFEELLDVQGYGPADIEQWWQTRADHDGSATASAEAETEQVPA